MRLWLRSKLTFRAILPLPLLLLRLSRSVRSSLFSSAKRRGLTPSPAQTCAPLPPWCLLLCLRERKHWTRRGRRQQVRGEGKKKKENGYTPAWNLNAAVMLQLVLNTFWESQPQGQFDQYLMRMRVWKQIHVYLTKKKKEFCTQQGMGWYEISMRTGW